MKDIWEKYKKNTSNFYYETRASAPSQVQDLIDRGYKEVAKVGDRVLVARPKPKSVKKEEKSKKE